MLWENFSKNIRIEIVNQLVYFLRNFGGAWVTDETLYVDRYGSEDSKNMFGLVWNLVAQACVTAEVENFQTPETADFLPGTPTIECRSSTVGGFMCHTWGLWSAVQLIISCKVLRKRWTKSTSTKCGTLIKPQSSSYNQWWYLQLKIWTFSCHQQSSAA